MRVIIDEAAAALAYAHSFCRTKGDANNDAHPENPSNDNLALWTDASAPPQNQAGPSGAAVVYRLDNKPTSNWVETSFSMLGSRKIHHAELVAILYALRIALRVCQKNNKQRTDANKAGGRLPSATVTIFSDCRGALGAIERGRIQNLSRLAALAITDIEECGFDVELRWVPAHRVLANKLADKLAGHARELLEGILKNLNKKELKKKGWREPPKPGPGRGCMGPPYFLIWPGRHGDLVSRVTSDFAELAARIWSKRLKPIVFTVVDDPDWQPCEPQPQAPEPLSPETHSPEPYKGCQPQLEPGCCQSDQPRSDRGVSDVACSDLYVFDLGCKPPEGETSASNLDVSNVANSELFFIDLG